MSRRRVLVNQLQKLAGASPQRTSLVQIVLVVLLITSLVPVALIGTLTFARSRTMLRSQFSRQMESTVTKNLEQVRGYIQIREEMMDRLANDVLFKQNLDILVNTEEGSEAFQKARSSLFVQMTIFFDYRSWAQTGTTGFFDELIIIRPDGQLLAESTSNWVLQNFGKTKISNPFILSLVGTNGSVMTFNAVPSISANQIAVYTTRTFKNIQGETVATMIATGSNAALYRAMDDTRDFFFGARAFYFTPEMQLIGPDDTSTTPRMIPIAPEPAFQKNLAALVQSGGRQTFFSATTQDHRDVQVYAQWMPEYQMGLILELPSSVVFSQLHILDPFNIAILVASLLISGTLIYYSTTRLVNPLVQLAHVAESFSKGNWNARANIQRSDEIGLLANAFNHMADDLSQLYRSMEEVMEKRTGQLRTAAEVAQLATSTTDIQETLARAVNLIAERFGYYHVALYLVDETGRAMFLSEAGGVAADEIKQRGSRMDIASHSLIGWVAANNRPRVITNVQTDEVFRPNPLLPDTRSEVGIPIASGSEVLGVLDIQSTQTDAFDPETVTVLQTLANQISGSLQNTRLLEATQVSYQETSLLYRTTRQVTQARSEAEIMQILADAFIQLPYVTLTLNAQDDLFRVVMVTDAKTGRVDRNLVNITIPAGHVSQILVENRVNLFDMSKPSEFDNILSFLYRRGCKTAALLSVVENGRLSKVLAIGSRETEVITHTSLQPYANLAEVIGASLEKFQVLSTLQQRLAELQALANVSQAISGETQINQLFRALHEQIMQVMGPELNFAVAIYNSQKNLIEFPYNYENQQLVPPIEPFQIGEGLTSYLLRERKPLLITRDFEQTAARLGGKQIGQPAKSWLGVPLIFANQVVGAMILQDLEHENAFTNADLNLFTTLAPQVATAIRNAQLLTETQNALKAYQLEHFLLNSLLDNTPDLLAFKDRSGKYIRASRSLADTYQVEIEALTGKSDFDLFDSETAARLWERQQQVLETGRIETEVFAQTLPSTGQVVWWQFSSIPIYETDEQPYGLLVIQRNITEVKAAEALAERRAEQVLTAAEIARDATGTLDVQVLQQKSVNLVRERFNFYHASIFTLDPLGEYAVLRESTGQAGEQMKRSGHRLAVGSRSIVGQVTAHGQALIVNDVTSDPNYYPNPLLPETRSELAIPLKVGDRILGALDVQSQQVNAFNQEDVNVLQILADQMAVALVNADLFAKTQELLGKHRLLRQITIAASASTTLEDALVNVVKGLRTALGDDRVAVMLMDEAGYLRTQASAGYEGTRHLELRLRAGEGIVGLAAAEKRPVRVDNTLLDGRYISVDPEIRSELAIPILFSEELIGILNLESTRISAYDENDEEILGALGNNLGGVIANIRLVQQVRQQVERERMLFEITSKIRHSVDMETILQTSTREICRVLGARRASIRITAGSPLYRAAGTTESNPSGEMPPASDGPRPGQNGRSNGGFRDNGHDNGEAKS